MSTLRAATRSSPLARWQTDRVAALLTAAHPGLVVEPVVVETTGDRDRTTPIHQLGGQGVFVKEVQAAVVDGRADIAVHSAKDLPSLTAAGLALAAVPERGDVRDVLVGGRLADLPAGAVIGTGSVRRRAQLAWARPDLRFAELRGNIATRLAKAHEHDAIVMAAAALDRLGEEPEIVDHLGVDVMLPQVAQGALAVECRADDATAQELLLAIEDPVARLAVDTERAFLAELGGGCELPVGALATVDGATVGLDALIAATDGSAQERDQLTGTGADVGSTLARQLLERGGRAFV